MITATQVAAVWTAPRNETCGSIQQRPGVSALELFCAQQLSHGMSDGDAVAWANELTGKFSTAGQCLDFTHKHYPSRVLGNLEKHQRSGDPVDVAVILETGK